MDEIAEALRTQREALGLSYDDIFERTRINPDFLEALDNNRFDALPKAYATLFLKTYARELGLDAEALLRRYEAALAPVTTETTPPPPQRTQAPIAVIAIAVGFIFVIAILAIQFGAEDTETVAPLDTAVAPAPLPTAKMPQPPTEAHPAMAEMPADTAASVVEPLAEAPAALPVLESATETDVPIQPPPEDRAPPIEAESFERAAAPIEETPTFTETAETASLAPAKAPQTAQTDAPETVAPDQAPTVEEAVAPAPVDTRLAPSELPRSKPETQEPVAPAPQPESAAPEQVAPDAQTPRPESEATEQVVSDTESTDSEPEPPAPRIYDLPVPDQLSDGQAMVLSGIVRQTTRLAVAADGRSIFSGELRAGSRPRWQARDSFRVRINRADAIHLSLQGQTLSPPQTPDHSMRLLVTRAQIRVEERPSPDAHTGVDR